MFSCGVKWSGIGEDLTMHVTYVFFIYLFGFIIPVSIIFTSYLKIIKTIKIKARIRASSSRSVNQTRLEKDRKLTVMVAVMVITSKIIYSSFLFFVFLYGFMVFLNFNLRKIYFN